MCKQYLQKEFKEYLEQNDTDEVSPGTVWDAAKAVIRGKLILWSSFRKREKQKQIKDLLQELNDSNVLDQIKLTKQNLKYIIVKRSQKLSLSNKGTTIMGQELKG